MFLTPGGWPLTLKVDSPARPPWLPSLRRGCRGTSYCQHHKRAAAFGSPAYRGTTLSRANLEHTTLVVPREPDGGVAALLVASHRPRHRRARKTHQYLDTHGFPLAHRNARRRVAVPGLFETWHIDPTLQWSTTSTKSPYPRSSSSSVNRIIGSNRACATRRRSNGSL